MLHPVLHPESGIYYLRRKVPDELRSALGRREYKKSLKTRDPAEARVRFTAALKESDEAFALARAQNGGTEVLGPQDAQQIAALAPGRAATHGSHVRLHRRVGFGLDRRL